RARIAARRLVRLVDEARHAVRQPVIAPRRAARIAHALLDDAPVAGGGEEEDMVVELITVLDGGAVHLGRRPARVHERLRVAADRLADLRDLLRRLARHVALAAGGEEPKLAVDVLQALFDRAADRRRHTARGPVEA